MLALPFVGHSAKGAQRWLELGGFSLQPSEFMKPALIVLAAWMFAEGQKGEGVPGVSIAFGLYGLAVALLLIQPDVGQTVLITIAFGAAFFMAGVPMSWILMLGRRGDDGPAVDLFPVRPRGSAGDQVPVAGQGRHPPDRPRLGGDRGRRPVRARARRGGDEAPRARPCTPTSSTRRRRRSTA